MAKSSAIAFQRSEGSARRLRAFRLMDFRRDTFGSVHGTSFVYAVDVGV